MRNFALFNPYLIKHLICGKDYASSEDPDQTVPTSKSVFIRYKWKKPPQTLRNKRIYWLLNKPRKSRVVLTSGLWQPPTQVVSGVPASLALFLLPTATPTQHRFILRNLPVAVGIAASTQQRQKGLSQASLMCHACTYSCGMLILKNNYQKKL